MPAKKSVVQKTKKHAESEVKSQKEIGDKKRGALSSVATAFKTYGEDLKKIGGDLALPYRHFVHWNVSKTVIFAYALIAGLVFSLPFLLAIGGVIFYALSFPAGEATAALVSSKESISTGLINAALFENFGKAALSIVLFLFVLATFSIFATYGYYLLAHAYRGYFEGIETPLRSNPFFDWKRVWKFAGVLGWSSLYVLAPILVGAALFLVAILLFATNSEEVSQNFVL